MCTGYGVKTSARTSPETMNHMAQDWHSLASSADLDTPPVPHTTIEIAGRYAGVLKTFLDAALVPSDNVAST